jgi:ubiquinone/menaquinone biosynthesis C-methylase UbiE
MSTKGQVNDLFTKTVEDWARFYSNPKPATMNDQNLVSRRRFALEMIEAKVSPGPDVNVLDIGCGTGHLAAELMRRGYAAFGVDLSSAMVDYAREHYDADRFRVGDIERIPFPDDTFDAVMCLGVMEYLEKDEPALREMWRVLKPGGHAVITTPSSICPFFYVDMAFRRMRYLLRPLVRSYRYTWRGKPMPTDELPTVIHRRYYQPRWMNLLRSMHLEPEDWVCHSWGFYCVDRFFSQGGFCRASDRFARNSAINWLASNQLVCVRSIKA